MAKRSDLGQMIKVPKAEEKARVAKALAGHAAGRTCRGIAHCKEKLCQRRRHGLHGGQGPSRVHHHSSGGPGSQRRVKGKEKAVKAKEKRAKAKVWDLVPSSEQSSKSGRAMNGLTPTGECQASA